MLAVTPPGLVAAYGFEENAGPVTADASGNGLAAILVGAAWTTDGKYGNALVFDGSTSGVTVIHDAPALRLTSAMTLEAWVKRSSSASQWTDVVYKGKDNYYLESATSTGRPGTGGIFGGTAATLTGPATLPVGTWAHLASTYDGVTLRLYVNGTQVASVARTGALATSGFPLQIGGDSFYEQRFAGTIDEVRVYNRALTPAEIQSDMATPLMVPVTDTTAPSAPGSLAAVAFSGTSIKLTWNTATDDVAVARYRIERCRGIACVDFQEVGSADGTAFTDTGLALNTSYSYRVTALDAAGNAGAPSGVAGAKTLASTAIPGLVAAYGFETGSGPSATDSSVNGNNGTIAGATWTAGRYGNALAFNGTSAKVNVPDSPSLRLTTALTLSAWVKLTALSPSTQWVDVLYKGHDNYYILASSDIGQQPELGGILGSGKHILFGLRRMTLGTWTHLALTYDGAMLRVFVDGLLVSSSPQTGPFITSTRPLQIGGDDDFGQYLTGTIDEVRLYNRALALEEIRADLATPVAGATNPTPTTSALAPSTLVAGGPGTSVDVTGSGFTSTSIVLWNDAPRATQLISPTLLRATIPSSDLVQAGDVPVAVFNAPPVGGTSNAQTFSVCAGSLWYRDADGDGRGDSHLTQSSCARPNGFVAAAGDCNDADATVWGVPGEAEALAFGDRQQISWSAPSSPGGTSLRYDTIRAEAPDRFEIAGTCVETGGEDTVSTDTSTPADGSVLFYLVRARNDCGEGSAGRPAAMCP